jgi:hypothetical protein
MHNLTNFEINGITPFHSPADNAEEALAQAHAILTTLAGAEQVCDRITEDEADGYDNIRHAITGRALEGIATLIAFAQFNLNTARRVRDEA